MIIIRIIFHYDHQHYHSKKLIEVRIDCSFWTTKQRYNIDTGMEQTSWKDSLKNEMLLLIGELRRVLPHSTKQKCRQYFSSFFLVLFFCSIFSVAVSFLKWVPKRTRLSSLFSVPPFKIYSKYSLSSSSCTTWYSQFASPNRYKIFLH